MTDQIERVARAIFEQISPWEIRHGMNDRYQRTVCPFCAGQYVKFEGHFENCRQAPYVAKAAIAATQEWQPIETAPKDGGPVLLSWDGKTVMARYLDNSRSAMPWQGWKLPSLEITPEGKPTHWMPLPAPPEGGE